MKKIGLIGGMGPESTVEYYRGIIDAFKQYGQADLDYPEIIIYSLNLSKLLGMMDGGRHQAAVDYLAAKLKGLEKAGADFVALTANTPHLFFDQLQEKTPLPLLSIVEATARQARRMKLQRPGLMGTGFTMNASFYRDGLKRHGMQLIVPTDGEKELIHHKLFSEIELGIFLDETRQRLSEIIRDMKQRDKIDGIIMGCTELPLILPAESYHDLPVLDTMKIHIREIVAWCGGETRS